MRKLLMLLTLQLVGMVVASPRPAEGMECTYAYYWTDQITIAKAPGFKPFACVNPTNDDRIVTIDSPIGLSVGAWRGVGAVEAIHLPLMSDGDPVACLSKGHVDGQYGLCGRCEDLNLWVGRYNFKYPTMAHQIILCLRH